MLILGNLINCSKDNINKRKTIKTIVECMCEFLLKNGYAIIPKNTIKQFFNSAIQPKIEKETKKTTKVIKKEKCESKIKKAWLCPHIYRIHYARGKCQNCYLNYYHKVYKIIISYI
jgi:hypothetical protein